MAETSEILRNIYYDPSHEVGFRGEKSLSKAVKNQIEEEDVRKWLQAQDAYTLHRPVRRKYPMLHYNVTNIDDV